MDNTLVENINAESHDSPIDDGDESLFNSLLMIGMMVFSMLLLMMVMIVILIILSMIGTVA